MTWVSARGVNPPASEMASSTLREVSSGKIPGWFTSPVHRYGLGGVLLNENCDLGVNEILLCGISRSDPVARILRGHAAQLDGAEQVQVNEASGFNPHLLAEVGVVVNGDIQ